MSVLSHSSPPLLNDKININTGINQFSSIYITSISKLLTLPAAGQGCCLAYRSNLAQHAIVQSAGTAKNYTHKSTAPENLYM